MTRSDNHPLAYWLWALGMVVALARFADLYAALLLTFSAGLVVARWQDRSSPWSNSFRRSLILASLVLTIRVFIGIALSIPTPGHLLFSLPRATLPTWVAGIGVGGPVTSERLGSALAEGAVIAGVITLIGAAVSLSQPRRLLRLIPGALHEAGIVIVIASTFVPQLIASIDRVREARRLRGRDSRGLHAYKGTALPVLEDALERATALAMAMESRGYGRTQIVSPKQRKATYSLMLFAITALVIGAFGLLTALTLPSLALVAVGIFSALLALHFAGERTLRTSYRREQWSPASLAIVLAAMAPALLTLIYQPRGSNYSISPLPQLTLMHGLLLISATPALLGGRP